MQIQGLQLPDLLVQMLESGEWYAPKNVDVVGAMMKGIKPGVRIDFLSAKGIDEAMTLLSAMYYELDMVMEYGLGASNGTDVLIENLEVMDIDKCLIIVATANDDYIFLDYRYSLTSPFVSATELVGDKCFRHYKVADSFEEFVKMVW